MNSAGIVALVAVLALATAFGLWRRRVDGKFNETKATSVAKEQHLTAGQLGQPLGDVATLVEFSSAFCAPCRATRKVLDRVVDDVHGIALIEIDAEQRLDLTRQFGVMRTPTVLILDSEGVVRHRAAGQPRYADVVGALGAVVPGASSTS
jgi:thiol-disulfide isomerase/thioredoxin